MVSAFYSTTSTQMPAFPVAINNIRANCIDPTVLGTFTETHDVPRMAYYTQDDTLLKTVSAWNILYDGIPIVYQGQEQRYRGNNDPYNREAVWLSGYSTNTPIYQLLKFLNGTVPIPPLTSKSSLRDFLVLYWFFSVVMFSFLRRDFNK
jgi:alpha-amylase